MIYLVCTDAATNSLYTSWMSGLADNIYVVDSYDQHWTPPSNADLVVTHRHAILPEISILTRLMQNNSVPVLILADGILEYRNTWSNRTIPPGSLYQPVLGHKMACLGQAQSRIIEAWGNSGKCEIVGIPKLDALSMARPDRPKHHGEFHLLVTSANAPAFDHAQWSVTERQFRELEIWINNQPMISGRKLVVTWRLADELDQRLGGLNEPVHEASSLQDAIVAADAVITTPSTVMLEAAVLRRPVAIIDFFNSPNYVPPAWSMTTTEQFAEVIQDLANPPAAKLLFQEQVLADQLPVDGRSGERMMTLVAAMSEVGRAARTHGAPIAFPARILDSDTETRTIAAVSRGRLYPDSERLAEYNVEILQTELEAWRHYQRYSNR